MASKQLTNTGVQLGDETHSLNSTSSEIIQKNQILYSLLTMSDEEFNTEYRSRENDAAANFKAQSSQHSSNDSTGSTSTKTSNKRKAMANFDDQSIKRHKDSRNAKQDAITTQNKKTDFVDEYLKKQQLIKSSHGKAQIRINNLKKVLLMLKSKKVPLKIQAKTLSLDMRQRIFRKLLKVYLANYRAVAKSTRAEFVKMKTIHQQL
ncbi:hypothetical protein DPMN_073803 [Dreissena polymorpha]|uniref:Uncharacterized protein n=1 Tax=Dreissena polymorpha TaxID=45954 RepID=A0A9D4HEJ5_DREPO|nr:hypothetical protein DPMN_073803 [Dreissena polymorpha]